MPDYDVLVTNPPFSGTHLGRILRFCAASGKPWMLLVRRRSSPRSDRAVNTRGEHPRAVHSTHSQRPRGRLRCVWSFRHHSRGKYWRVPFERSKTGANNSKRIVGAELCLPQALLPPRARRRAVRVGGTLSGPSRGILGGISVPHSESVLYGVFVRAHRVLNSRKRWFPASGAADKIRLRQTGRRRQRRRPPKRPVPLPLARLRRGSACAAASCRAPDATLTRKSS